MAIEEYTATREYVARVSVTFSTLSLDQERGREMSLSSQPPLPQSKRARPA